MKTIASESYEEKTAKNVCMLWFMCFCAPFIGASRDGLIEDTKFKKCNV